jgi:hypothetical protein
MRWFSEMMELVISIPIQFRVNADGVMLRITRSSKLVTRLGQQSNLRPEVEQAPALLRNGLVQWGGCKSPSDDCHSELEDCHAGLRVFRDGCQITSTVKGWVERVEGKAWIEWATVLCESLQL